MLGHVTYRRAPKDNIRSLYTITYADISAGVKNIGFLIEYSTRIIHN